MINYLIKNWIICIFLKIETNDEWWILKKKYLDTYSNSTNFFFNTFQRTKNNLSKAFNKENSQVTASKQARLQQQQLLPSNDESNTNRVNNTITTLSTEQAKEDIIKNVLFITN